MILQRSDYMNAIFFDRDGVINEPVYHLDKQNYRAPWMVSEFKLLPHVIKSLKQLNDAGYPMYLVTNQPDYANGNTSYNELKDIKYHLIDLLAAENIIFKEHYYCFHKSNNGCECRKPSPHFLFKAAKEYNINLKESWMVGDRDTDVYCGQNAGTKTILILNKYEEGYVGKSNPDFKVNNIKEAVDIILKEEENEE